MAPSGWLGSATQTDPLPSLTVVRPILAGVQPNRPKMATVVLSIILLVVGLALVFYQGSAVELVRSILPGDLQRQVVSLMAERFFAWAILAASPLLLIVGSLVRGV